MNQFAILCKRRTLDPIGVNHSFSINPGMTNFTEQQINRIGTYREMQRTIPGLFDMYHLVAALILHFATRANQVLISGAGGGREIEALAAAGSNLDITAIDPSQENLQCAKMIAGQHDTFDYITFWEGTVDDLPDRRQFNIVTSCLIMHLLADERAKLNYLKALKKRVARGGILIHADVCHEGVADMESLVPIYQAYAKHVGVADSVVWNEIDTVSQLPIVSPSRVRELLVEAGFSAPREIFRSLWYRCWISAGAK